MIREAWPAATANDAVTMITDFIALQLLPDEFCPSK